MTTAEIVNIGVAEVRESVRIAMSGLEKAAEQIVWQIENQAWTVLGYEDWNTMRTAEYGGAAFMVPRDERPELFSRMRESGLTQQEIADTAGVSVGTVNADLNFKTENQPTAPRTPITNSRGQQRPASYATRKPSVAPVRTDTAPGVERPHVLVDRATGEVLDPAPKKKAAPRRALPVVFFEAKFDLRKRAESLRRLTRDDRFPQNVGKVAQENLNDLRQIRDLLEQVIALLNKEENTNG